MLFWFGLLYISSLGSVGLPPLPIYQPLLGSCYSRSTEAWGGELCPAHVSINAELSLMNNSWVFSLTQLLSAKQVLLLTEECLMGPLLPSIGTFFIWFPLLGSVESSWLLENNVNLAMGHTGQWREEQWLGVCRGRTGWASASWPNSSPSLRGFIPCSLRRAKWWPGNPQTGTGLGLRKALKLNGFCSFSSFIFNWEIFTVFLLLSTLKKNKTRGSWARCLPSPPSLLGPPVCGTQTTASLGCLLTA